MAYTPKNRLVGVAVPKDRYKRLKALARERKTNPTRLAREWVLERLELEAPMVETGGAA